MNDIINKPIVLKLNASWMVLGPCTVKQAIIDMTGGSDGKPAALAIDFEYQRGPDGEWDYLNPVYMNPVSWETWASLPIREYDIELHSSKLTVRAPTVIIASNYNKIPLRTPRVTKDAIYKRDGLVCQYTGKSFPRKDLDIDHIIPVSRGGKNTFSNMVVSSIPVNRKKGNLFNHEAGLKLIRVPKEPSPIPVVATIDEIKHPAWRPFVLRTSATES
jgi:5-methylcytosine-specific restriction endonuclease McrA